MTRTTPRATPVAPAPDHSAGLHAPAPEQPYPLRAPVIVVGPEGERELTRGALIVGRLPGCDITLEDPLVSREHARLVVLEGGLIAVEDLHSTNGIYVNGLRVSRGQMRLRDGDRVLIGTTELSLFAGRTPALLERPRTDQNPERARPHTTSLGSDAVPATDRADAIDVIGRLATRHAEKGNLSEAVRVLSTHLNKVLLGATAGLVISDSLLERAARLAHDLFRWTGNVAWFDYIVELHLAAQRLPSEQSLRLLEAALRLELVPFDRMLLSYLVEKLVARSSALGPEEQARLCRLEQLSRF